MRNFMCYREQELNLEGIHLACLTGSNGHGKSAILDAMTWALWGHSRVGARRDDELIHLGQTEMEVEFEFALPHHVQVEGGVRYRIIRKRDSKKRGQSALEMQGWDADSAKFRSLTEPTISQTQDRINELVRMDYETFINSAFLLQGRADEFTIKRPSDRKRVLGDILGLGLYDRYETLAKENAQERKSRADQIMATVEQIDAELAREPEYRAAVQEAKTELSQLQKEREDTERRYREIRSRVQEAQAAQQQLTALERQIDADRAALDQLVQELETHRARLGELEAALTQENEIEAGFVAYQRAVASNDEWNAKLAASATLKEQRAALEQAIAAARHQLELERQAASEEVRQLQGTADALGQEDEWQELVDKLAHLDARADLKEQSQTEIQSLLSEVATLQSENKRATEDANQIKDKIALLSAHDENHGEGARCPLCEQPLTESGCSQLLANFQTQLDQARESYRERNMAINASQRQIQDLKATIADIDSELQQRTGLQRQEAALAHVLDSARQALQALPAAQEELTTLETALEHKSFATQEQEALATVEKELSTLGYDADTHRSVQAELEQLRTFDRQMQTLREARMGIEPERLAIAQYEQRRSEAETRLDAQREQADAYRQVVDQLPDLRRQAMDAQETLENAHDREQQAGLRLGAAQNKVDYCADLKEQRVQRLEEEQELRREQAIYQELRRAFGKNGVQAMLIESAIPDIEEEANRLLARMSQGRMHVRFETQRDTKKGDTVETLDIHITDELGTRSYETYSGGERYRINFAIRIALSKLLAHRAGAQLQLLVIDEGFGTQDNEGREGLIDAINAIEGDFACILVITHIEELKDTFNVRIEVEKTPQGSEITVV